MANTYSQVNIHCIFAVKGRENIITRDFRDELHRYISGILKNKGAFSLAVGGWLDHVHTFFELPVTIAISDLMRDVKASSSGWINENKFVKGTFHWQEGYGAFSYSRSQRDGVIKLSPLWGLIDCCVSPFYQNTVPNGTPCAIPNMKKVSSSKLKVEGCDSTLRRFRDPILP